VECHIKRRLLYFHRYLVGFQLDVLLQCKKQSNRGRLYNMKTSNSEATAVVRTRHAGLHCQRLLHNPEELRFADEWDNINQRSNVLAWLLGHEGDTSEVSDNDCKVAATVIQWLGSPVGRQFLNDAGYIHVPQDLSAHKATKR
jgi:hypothetical protein